MERWDYASLLVAGSKPCGSPLKSKARPAADSGRGASSWGRCPTPPLGEGWEFELVDRQALLRD